MNLTKHFTLEKLIHSDTADSLKIDNTPTEVHLKILKHTCEYLLEPLRKLLNEHYGDACILITSGYRSSKLNKAIGGAKNSQHSKGEAVDIQVVANKKRIPHSETYELIKKWVKEGVLSVDQLISEESGSSKWVHISHSSWGKTKDRKQFLIYKNGIYTQDLT